jgi:hypothetical protein
MTKQGQLALKDQLPIHLLLFSLCCILVGLLVSFQKICNMKGAPVVN